MLGEGGGWEGPADRSNACPGTEQADQLRIACNDMLGCTVACRAGNRRMSCPCDTWVAEARIQQGEGGGGVRMPSPAEF